MPPGRARKFERKPTAAPRGARLRDVIKCLRGFNKWRKNMKNWKTSLASIAVMIGAPLATAGEGWVQVLGTILISVGGAGGLLSAADGGL